MTSATAIRRPLFDYLVRQLDARKLAYIHVIEGATGGPRDVAPVRLLRVAQGLSRRLYRQ